MTDDTELDRVSAHGPSFCEPSSVSAHRAQRLGSFVCGPHLLSNCRLSQIRFDRFQSVKAVLPTVFAFTAFSRSLMEKVAQPTEPRRCRRGSGLKKLSRSGQILFLGLLLSRRIHNKPAENVQAIFKLFSKEQELPFDTLDFNRLPLLLARTD